jgi:hypothetical protein
VATRQTDLTGRLDFTVPCPHGRHTAMIADAELRLLAFTGFTC